MDSVTLAELVRRSSLSAVEIVVVSRDPEFYSAEVVDGGKPLMVFDGQKPLLTRSLGAMKRALKDVRSRRVALRHVSAFDEMIGMPSVESGAVLEIPIALYGVMEGVSAR